MSTGVGATCDEAGFSEDSSPSDRPSPPIHASVEARSDSLSMRVVTYVKEPGVVPRGMGSPFEGVSPTSTCSVPFFRRDLRLALVASLRAAPCVWMSLQSSARTWSPRLSRKLRERYA